MFIFPDILRMNLIRNEVEMETVRVFHSNGNNTGYDLQDISIFTVLGGTMKYILETTKETYQVPLNTRSLS